MPENLVHQPSDENFGYVENFLVVLLPHSSGESIYLFEYLEQSKIARDISRSKKIIISEREFTGLIVGRRDKISLPVNAADGVKIDKFVELDTGHLSVLDSPELVAELILAE